MWFLWSQSGWVQASCSISYKGGFLHTVQLSTITSCQRVLWQSSSGKVIWVQEGMEFQRGSPLHSSQNRLWGCTISTGHPNTRPTRVSSKDWLAQTVTDKKWAVGREVRGKKRRKTCSHCFNLYYIPLISAPCPPEAGFSITWSGRERKRIMWNSLHFFSIREQKEHKGKSKLTFIFLKLKISMILYFLIFNYTSSHRKSK